ncbi:hypothetical protein KSF_036620 [Reticulibacter mediterranei]|uniref:Uncharacterized protein n=1 Tax=Reticulibacter mediterranei TaxID=2778369 RepID=A0A8J3IDY3_9CHLR|nr:hypothetical protein [Reticulibacter mediterranei]GHO93614.1 hypothetical protein KSF_036620 [Reticulibacter mediterranei]
MDLFIEIVGPLTVAAMLASLVICAVDGIKRAPTPYYDYVRTNNLSKTALTYGIVGATLAGWSWYRYVTLPTPYGVAIALGIIMVIAASIFGFGGYWAGRGIYRTSRALRQRILGSLSIEEQRELVQTLPGDILSAEVLARIAAEKLTLSIKEQCKLALSLPGDILSAEVSRRIEADTLNGEEQCKLALALSGDILSTEVSRRIKADTLNGEEQRLLVLALSGDILSAEVLARIAAEELNVRKQRELMQALPGDILISEVDRRIDAGTLSNNEARRIVGRAPRQSLIDAFCQIKLSDGDLTSYDLKRLANCLGLDRLVTMVSSLDTDSLNDDNLKKLADLLDLKRLVDMLLFQIATQEERSYTRLNTIDQQIRELNGTLRESDGRVVELRERILTSSQANSELPDELRSVNSSSLTQAEVERLKGMIFTDEERKELLGELMKMLTRISRDNAKHDGLEQRRTSMVRQQNILRGLRPAAQRLKDLLDGYGTKQ